MAIVICPKCGKPGNLPEQHLGKKIKCRQCASTFLAGQETSKAKAAPAAPASPASEPLAIDPKSLFIAPLTLRTVPEALAREHGVLPIKLGQNMVTLAMADPSATTVIEKLRFILNLEIEPVAARREDIEREIDRRYRQLKPLAPPSSVTYFECSRPPGDATCSDDSCPCGVPGATIARGHGYLYISAEVVEFRHDALAESAAAAKIQKVQHNLNALIANPNVLASPILMCKLGAEKRGIDQDVAGQDARHWWNTGQVPLRPTPLGQPTPAPAAADANPPPADAGRQQKAGDLLERCIVLHFEKTGEFISNQKSVQWLTALMRLSVGQIDTLLGDPKALERFVLKLAKNPATAWLIA